MSSTSFSSSSTSSSPPFSTNCKYPGMNLSLFDGIVEEFLFIKEVISFPSFSETPPHYQEVILKINKQKELKDYIAEIKKLMLDGKLIEATHLINKLDPTILEEPKLMFEFHKQQFIEYLRSGAYQKAIDYSRHTFGPYSLNSYPEAYSEFKSTLLLLIYCKQKPGTPVSNLWYDLVQKAPLASFNGPAKHFNRSASHLENLCSTICSTLTSSLQLIEPSKLILMTIYLILIHNYYHKTMNISSPFQDNDLFAFLERESLPLIKSGQNNFVEKTVQALVQALGLTRENAINSLKYTNGNVSNAFLNELSKIKLNESKLLDLALQYGAIRGILSKDHISTLKLKFSVSEEDIEKIERIKKIRKLTEEGNITQVLESAHQFTESFDKAFPNLYFQLYKRQYLVLLQNKEFDKAIQILRMNLTPITLKHPELVEDLKHLSLMMAVPFEFKSNNINSMDCLLGGSVFSSLSQKIGVEEPALVKLYKYLLNIHTLWFKYQQCEDEFDNVFSLHQLKQPDVKHYEENDVANAEKRSLDILSETENKHANPVHFEENSILTIMEFMALTRAEAILLLSEFKGNLDSIFETYLS